IRIKCQWLLKAKYGGRPVLIHLVADQEFEDGPFLLDQMSDCCRVSSVLVVITPKTRGEKERDPFLFQRVRHRLPAVRLPQLKNGNVVGLPRHRLVKLDGQDTHATSDKCIIGWYMRWIQ